MFVYFQHKNNFLFRLLDTVPEKHGQRQVTRLHLHTLAFQAIMVRKTSPWKNNLAAVTKAALTANRHVCGISEVGTLINTTSSPFVDLLECFIYKDYKHGTEKDGVIHFDV